MLHRWDLTPKQAVDLQKELRKRLRFDRTPDRINRVAGVDVSYRKADGASFAVVCALTFPGLELIETSCARMATPFPYVPGLLSFREVPPILAALDKLSSPIDLIFVDGHGQAHPRRLGIASHLGLWLDHPTIGIGKSRLCGEFREPGGRKGDASELVDRGEVVGTVLRTRSGVRPIFVSVGYGLLLTDAVRLTLQATPRFRLPEPIRRADHLAAALKQQDRM